MRLFLGLLCGFFITSCWSNKEDVENQMVLGKLIENSYEYFELSTGHIDYPDFQPRIDIERIKNLSYEVSGVSSNSKGKKGKQNDLKKELEYVIKQYNQNIDFSEGAFPLNLGCSLETELKVLEYVAINSIILDFYSNNLIFDYYRPLVVPGKTKLKVGETFTAEVYFAVNDFNNPYQVVIDNDTIKPLSDFSRDAPLFSIKTTQPGKFTHNGKLLTFHRGEEIVLLFKVEYEVE